jgi:hypothetical protein
VRIQSLTLSTSSLSTGTEFSPAAEAHLQWATIEATWDIFANAELVDREKQRVLQETANVLRTADEATLLKHAKQYLYCVQRAQTLQKMQDKEKARIDALRPDASGLKKRFIKQLKSQMVYAGLSMFQGDLIRCSADYVAQAIFSEAFGVGPHVTKLTLDGSLCGSKSLRYGGEMLLEGNNTVKLTGETLVASASYIMLKSYGR